MIEALVPGFTADARARGKTPGQGRAVSIAGLTPGVAFSLAACCHPVPGDRIVGIMTPGEGITVYPIQSPALEAFDDQPERWLDVRWDVEDAHALFPAKIMVAAINEPGSLGSVATLIGEQGANIDDVKFNKKSPDFREMVFDVQVFDLKHLNDILSRVRALPMVHSVERVIG